jgi:ring-1,2-phenylacetyl-CoA epoxidase subunit PaaE
METAEKTIKSIGFKDSAIHHESFFSTAEEDYKAAKKGDSKSHSVMIKLNGEDISFDVGPSKSILFTGLDNGYDMPYSCQSGLCTACMGKCISGKVEMSESDGLTEEQIAEGYVLTCVGHPASDDVVIEFE